MRYLDFFIKPYSKLFCKGFIRVQFKTFFVEFDKLLPLRQLLVKQLHHELLVEKLRRCLVLIEFSYVFKLCKTFNDRCLHIQLFVIHRLKLLLLVSLLHYYIVEWEAVSQFVLSFLDQNYINKF